MYRQFSPLSHLNKNDPPVLIIHGQDDTIVEVQHSRVLSEALAKLEIEHELEIIQGAGHGFGIELAENNILATLLSFLKRHLHTPQ